MFRDRYSFGEELGRGAMGVVYIARDQVLGRQVAVKVLSARDPERRRRFLREAQVAARFRHASAIEIYELADEGDELCIAMELVRAPTLAQLLEHGALEEAHAREIGGALAEALAAAHAGGLIHRDVKPSNAFVEREPLRVRLADFGLAYLRDPDRDTLGRLTEEGLVLGTPAYMPPEQIEGNPLTPAADVYALAATIYELVVGSPPFEGATVPAIFAAHLYLPPIPPSERREALGPDLDAVILAGLAKQPADRPTAAAFAAMLQAPPRERTRATRPAAIPRLSRTRQPVVVWTDDTALAAALVAEGVAIARPCDVEVIVATDAPPTTTLAVLAHPDPTPARLAAAVRAGYQSVVRWPGSAAAIASALARFGRVAADQMSGPTLRVTLPEDGEE